MNTYNVNCTRCNLFSAVGSEAFIKRMMSNHACLQNPKQENRKLISGIRSIKDLAKNSVISVSDIADMLDELISETKK